MSCSSVYLANLGVANALGEGKSRVFDQLMRGSQSGIVERRDLLVDGMPVCVGEVGSDLPEVPGELRMYESRNVRLLMLAAGEIRSDIDAAIARVGPDRVAVVIGTSSSGIREVENELQGRDVLPDDFDTRRHEFGSASEFLAAYLGVSGVACTIATACSSASHALAMGARLLKTGVADIVLAGGADSLCQTTVNGFHQLALLSKTICNPFSKNRDGITIGEGSAIFLMQRERADIALLGYGASSDGYSLTAPDPTGAGIQAAIHAALDRAGLAPDDISYVHLHGTGTRQNDTTESLAVKNMFGDTLPYSSSKAQIGHTLGAAGVMGAAHCWLAARRENSENLLPPHVWDNEPDPGLLADNFVEVGQAYSGERPIFMINSFAFGGNNVSLIVGRDV